MSEHTQQEKPLLFSGAAVALILITGGVAQVVKGAPPALIWMTWLAVLAALIDLLVSRPKGKKRWIASLLLVLASILMCLSAAGLAAYRSLDECMFRAGDVAGMQAYHVDRSYDPRHDEIVCTYTVNGVRMSETERIRASRLMLPWA